MSEPKKDFFYEDRFSRQILLEEVQKEGQDAIRSTSVLVVGVGGLGSSCCMYLATCGISTLGIADFDIVEITNLHRQIIHSERFHGKKKIESASQRIKELNSELKLELYYEFNEKNGLELVQKYDIIVDCTDNPKARYLINDACVLSNKPLVSGTSVRFEGQLSVYNYEDGPCYRCLFPKPPPPQTVMKCSKYGVLGVIPGIIGCLQSLEVQKIALRKINPDSFEVMKGRMLLFNGKNMKFRDVKLRTKQKNCPVCGENRTINALESI